MRWTYPININDHARRHDDQSISEPEDIEDNSKNDNETSDLHTPSLFFSLSLSCDRSKKRRSPTHAPEGTAAPACSETEPLCHAQLSADWLGRGRTDS